MMQTKPIVDDDHDSDNYILVFISFHRDYFMLKSYMQADYPQTWVPIRYVMRLWIFRKYTQLQKQTKLDLETDLDTVAWYLLAEVTPSWPWPHEWNWGSQAYVFI